MPHSASRRVFLGSMFGGAAAIGHAGAYSSAERTAASPDPVPLKEPMSLWEVPTPALVVDQDKLESNLQKMAEHYRGKTTNWRPHAKTHKCPILAKKQLALGAVGICAAKVSEAEVLLDAGIEDILITSPVVTKEKIDQVLETTQGTG